MSKKAARIELLADSIQQARGDEREGEEMTEFIELAIALVKEQEQELRQLRSDHKVVAENNAGLVKAISAIIQIIYPAAIKEDAEPPTLPDIVEEVERLERRSRVLVRQQEHLRSMDTAVERATLAMHTIRNARDECLHLAALEKSLSETEKRHNQKALCSPEDEEG